MDTATLSRETLPPRGYNATVPKVGVELDEGTHATECEMTEYEESSSTSADDSSAGSGTERENQHGESYVYSAPQSPEELHVGSAIRRCVSTGDLVLLKSSAPATSCLNSVNQAMVLQSTNLETQGDKKGHPVKRKKGVVFGDVIIRSYNQVLGDNCSCSYGPPLSLDWEYTEFEALPLDAYEAGRPARRSPRQMVLSYYYRKNLLMFYYGYTEEDLKKAKKDISKQKFQRSLSTLPTMHVEAIIESVARKTKRFFGNRKKNKKHPDDSSSVPSTEPSTE